jgi:hypothetical protein
MRFWRGRGSPICLMKRLVAGRWPSPRSPPLDPPPPSCGPVLTRLWWKLPLARSRRASRGRGPFCSRRNLSHRLVGWCGDHFRGLQAEGSRNNGAVRGRARESRDAVRGDRRWCDRGAHPKHARKELEAYLGCGPLCRGFARLWCGECRRSVVVAFSCRGRSFCPSCEKKKQLLWAEWLREEVRRERPCSRPGRWGTGRRFSAPCSSAGPDSWSRGVTESSPAVRVAV